MASTSDAVIVELEDAVSEANKPQARAAAAVFLDSLGAEHSERQRPSAWARVNRESLAADLEAVVKPTLAGVFLPKCTPAVLAEFDEIVGELERHRDAPARKLEAICLIESAEGLLALRDIVRHPRVRTLAVGEVDLLADLRMVRSDRTASVIDGFRARIVLGCAAAGLTAPVSPTSVDFADLDAFRESTRRMLELGFRSRTAIHPDQVAVINDVFTPSAAEIVEARDLMRRLAESPSGVALDSRGRLIDKAVIRQATEVLDRSS